MLAKALCISSLASACLAATISGPPQKQAVGPWTIVSLGARAGLAHEYDYLTASPGGSMRTGIRDFKLLSVSHEMYGLLAARSSSDLPVQANSMRKGQRINIGKGGPPTTFQYEKLWPKRELARGKTWPQDKLAKDRQCFIIKTPDQKLAWSTRDNRVGDFRDVAVTLAKLNRDDTHQIFCFRRKQRTKPVSEAQTPVPEGSYAIVSVGESGEVIARAGTLQVVLVDSGFLHGPKSLKMVSQPGVGTRIFAKPDGSRALEVKSPQAGQLVTVSTGGSGSGTTFGLRAVSPEADWIQNGSYKWQCFQVYVPGKDLAWSTVGVRSGAFTHNVTLARANAADANQQFCFRKEASMADTMPL